MSLLITEKEMMANVKPPEWVIPDLLEADSLAAINGRFGSGKSFVALSMGMSLSHAHPFAGREIEHSHPVVYLMGEGHNGMSRRVKAWYHENGLHLENDDASIAFSKSSVPLIMEKEAHMFKREIDVCIEENWSGQAPKLIVVDTLSRNFGGDENSNKEMMEFIYCLDHYLRAPYGACVLLIHHTGRLDPSRGRGASALPCALDWEYLATWHETETGNGVHLDCTKVKDAPRPNQRELWWELVQHKFKLNGDIYESAALRHTPQSSGDDPF